MPASPSKQNVKAKMSEPVASHGSVSLDWPLSRDEKKGRVMQLFQRDLRAADRMINMGDQDLEEKSAEAEALSNLNEIRAEALRKIISEAEAALGHLEHGDKRKSSCSSKTLPVATKAKEMPEEFPDPSPSHRLSLASEPEKEPSDFNHRTSMSSEPEKKLLAQPPQPTKTDSSPSAPAQQGMFLAKCAQGYDVVNEKIREAQQSCLEALTCELPEAVYEEDQEEDEEPLLDTNMKEVPKDFATFLGELVTYGWDSNGKANFLKTD